MVFSFLIHTASLSAADRYWVGGSGNWSDPAHWSATNGGRPGASVPGSGDQAWFTNTSFTSPGQQVTVDLPLHLQSIHWSVSANKQAFLQHRENLRIQGDLLIDKGSWKTASPALFVTGTIRVSNNGTFEAGAEQVVCSGLTTAGTGAKLVLRGTKIFFTGPGFQKDPAAKITVVSDGYEVNGRSFVPAGNNNVPGINSGGQLSPQTHTVITVVVPNLCNGDCMATATAIVSGGSGSFSYVWSNGDTGALADSLCAGTYLVVVTDLINGDQIPAFAIVTDPPPLVIFFSNVPPLCNGQCNGSSTASVAGGTPGYLYSWAPGGQTTPAITNQCAGSYVLTVTDVNGCSITQTSVITQPAALNPQGTNIDVSCNGFCDGSAQVNPIGGTGLYSYSWAPGGQTTNSINGLCPGNYTCTITDINNCTSTYIAVITQPNPLAIQGNITNASCNGVCDGAISTSVSGGTAPYSYSWAPGGQTTPNLSGLCDGSYTLTVTDANGCTLQQVFNVTEPAPLLVNPTGINITCFNACNGIAQANASGGTVPYTYSWSPAGGNVANPANLCPGTYTVTVTDANGCTATGSVTLIQPALLIANASDIDITCFGACDGSATSNPVGGTSPYTYVWQPGNLGTQTINNLCPGSYSLTVTDVNGCTATATVTITEPLQLQPNVNVTNVSCNGVCDGTATSTPTGGTAPYSYSWAPGGQTTSSISGLCAGNYTCTVTDANGCVQTQNFTVTQPNPLTSSVNATQIPCNSSCNASLAAVVAGGTAPFSYVWAPGGQTTSTINNQCAGSYTVTVTDANGCTTTSSVTIAQPTALVLTQSTTPTSCNGVCDGSASIAVIGGTPAYTYSWAPGGQTTAVINNVCAGTYTVTVTDANACTGTETITVTEPTALQPNLASIDATCNGQCNGIANANPTGGTAPYTFLWSPGGQTTSSINGLCIGTYTCVVTDANGCSANQTVTIAQPSPLSAVVSATTSSCGICNGTATINVSGGTSPYAYFWLPSGGTNPTATGLCVGQYTCNVTDANGCVTSVVANINQVVNIIITSVQTSLSCFGACDGVASANASGGNAPYSYSWAPGGQTTQNVSGLCSGTYTVTVTDALGCFNSAQVTFVDPPLLTLTSSSTDASCNGVCDGSASVVPAGGTGAYSYSWAPGGQTTSSINGLCAGTYTVTVSDANNCTATQSFTITEASLIVANDVSSPANCTMCDGSITINPSGGIGPYTYSWAPGGQTTATISNLCPGIYTVTITDNSGCSVNTPVAVSNLNGPTVQATSTNATCNAVCDGTANANVVGGVAPFTYDWSPGSPTGDGTNAVTGLCAGTWFVQVTDAVGCITFTSVIITEPQPLAATATIVSASCNGVCDGSITTNASGGTGPYTYSWAPGGQTTPSINGQCAGTYTLTLTDANGCSNVLQFTITEPVAVGANMTFTDVTCSSACNGTAQATVTGGTAPFTYSWTSGQITPSVANLCPGTYSVTITDANGCTTQQQVTITEPTALQTSVSGTDATCFSSCDGTATVVANGGVPGYTYLWSPGNGTTATALNLCAGVYSITTMDANGCSSVQSLTINQPPAITGTTSVTSVSCFGSCDGSATVAAGGGSGALTYLWMPGGATTATASGLCPGVYTVTVTDANSCTITLQATVAQPVLLQANTSFTSPSCNGACDGTASANPVGGTGPYSYLWAPGGQNTQTISGLCAGTYTVTVNDANNCQDIQVVTVTPASAITVAVASSPANCGSCNGTITVLPAGGTAPYNYVWSGGLPAQPNQSSLCAGLYTVTVTDASGCGNTFTIPVNNSGGPTGETVTTTGASCSGICDGTGDVVPIGGTAPYTFLWPGGQTTSTVNGLCAGSYFVQVTDANGCIRFSPVTITEPPAIVPNPFVTNSTCTGICDGAIALGATGGTGPYTYLWAPGGQTTPGINALCAGSYTVTITDASGCTQSDTSVVAPWNTLSVNITTSGLACGNLCNGSATANITGGTAPVTYQWNDPLSQVTQIASGLCAGSYTVNVVDGMGCNVTANTTLNAPSVISITPAVINTTCGQCNGSVNLNTSGGTAPYTYLWSNGATTQNVASLCAGVYAVVITDAAGCTAQYNVTVSATNAPSANLTSTNATCFGTCDGSATVAPSGGTAPYTILWLPGAQTGLSVNNLCAGAYNVQVMDNAGCIVTQSFTVAEPAQLTANQSITNTDCGVCSGSITVNPSGGTGPYTYLWAPGGQTTATISGLCAGLYTLTITDANACTQQVVIPVNNVNSSMTLTTASTNVTCFGVCDGTASVNVAGGVAPFTYLWSNGGNTNSLTALCAGIYFVQVTDANGCVSTAQVIITEPAQLALSFANVIPESCPGMCNGTITILPSGGTLSYSYSWSNAQTTQTATGLCAGSYNVTVTDANGCTVTQTNSFVAPQVLVLGVPNITGSSCNTVPDGAIDITVSGGTLPYTYQWTGPSNFTASTEDLTNILSGTYTVIITDNNGCQVSDTLTVIAAVSVLADAGNDTTSCDLAQVTLDGSGSTNATSYQWFQLPGLTLVGSAVTAIITPPTGTTSYILVALNGSCADTDTVMITASPLPAVDAGASVTILAGSSTVIGGNPTGPAGSTYTWGPVTGLGDPVNANPVATPSVTTTYTVTVTNSNGCSATDTVTVTILPEIAFPNGFTPNGDGTNDVWVIDNIQLFKNCAVEVYNRWGELLFRSVGYTTPWDGRYNGQELPVGTYYYVIDLNDPLFPEDYTGPITIMR
ncbi:MAG: hypothetical protein FD123_601 [Bacteroidetes bacterium]|nr:MAG: hypothetical protein FD123_601 [Bacteroidota bacterium]